MLVALDENGERVHIECAKRNQDYFCPCCKSKVVLKKGDIRVHHFAHPQQSICQDTWHYDMSEWHYEWQNRFPKEWQEIVKTKGGKTHRADVLIEKEKTVVEFQHSPLSPEEFSDRNAFYNDLGYKVIWVFDEEEAYSNGQFDNYKDSLWKWKHPRKTFDYFNCKNKGVEVFLQLECEIIDKVTWCTGDNGFSRFILGDAYENEEFVDMLNTKIKNGQTEFKLSELYDELIELNTEDHSTYFFGCPISSTHTCTMYDIDIPTSEYSKVMPCNVCEFQCEEDAICKKRFLDLHLDGNTIVKIESRDENGFINKISYTLNEKRIYIQVPTFEQNISKDVFTLWEENNCAIATFRNIKTDIYIRIIKNPREQYRKYRKVYGFFSKTKYSFPKESKELFGVEKREWVCEWFRKK